MSSLVVLIVVAVVSDVFDVHSSGDDPLLLLEDGQLVGLVVPCTAAPLKVSSF